MEDSMKRLLLAAPLTPVLLALAFASAPPAASAGVYDEPWTVIASDPRPSADPAIRPVIVNRVDGENSARNQVVIAPGPHMVTVGLPPRQGFSLGTQETFDLTTSPCMRYYISASLDNPVSQRWKPVVRYSELIGECAAKFKTEPPPK
jgi:hypothetical protein